MIIAYDGAGCLAVAVVLSLAFATPAYAYIDPSVMTYTIQAVAGVAVALSAVLGVVFRRGRKKVMALLDVDENARRVVEPDVMRVNPYSDGGDLAAVAAAMDERTAEPGRLEADSFEGATGCPAEGAGPVEGAGPAEGETGGPAEGEGEAEGVENPPFHEDGIPTGSNPLEAKRPKRPFFDKRRYAPPWKTRLILGFIASFFIVYTVYYVAPLEIVAGSLNSLSFGIADLWWVPLAPCMGIVAALTLALSALRGRAFSIALTVVFAVGFCAYAQALFLNVGLPAANGAAILWSDYMFMQVVSTAVWAIIVLGALVMSFHNRVRMQGVVVIVSVFLVAVQSVGLASLAISPATLDSGKSAKTVLTEDHLFTVNENHNVIVFILDTYDTAYLRRVLKMNPDLLDELSGFTNYENATSALIPTRFAIPEMMTGQMPDFDEKFSTYVAERYARSSFLGQIHDANYSVGLYTDSMRISTLSPDEQYDITSKTVNMHPLSQSTMNYGGALYSLFQMGQYRDVPWSLKWAFWYYTDEINQSMVAYSPDAAPADTAYVIDDVRYYNRLKDIGLSIEEGGYDGAYRFIHLLGSHYPFSYDEEASFIGDDESDVFRQSQGAIHIVSEYIRQLKELGVYENTTLIVTADHGYWTITLDPIQETSTPIMFVKPEQSAEEDARPIRVDEKPVSHLDLQATVLDAMGLDYSEYSERDFWEGYSMFDDIDPARKRYYLTTDSLPDLTEVQFREYLIEGNALDWNSWSETGRVIDAQE